MNDILFMNLTSSFKTDEISSAQRHSLVVVRRLTIIPVCRYLLVRSIPFLLKTTIFDLEFEADGFLFLISYVLNHKLYECEKINFLHQEGTTFREFPLTLFVHDGASTFLGACNRNYFIKMLNTHNRGKVIWDRGNLLSQNTLWWSRNPHRRNSFPNLWVRTRCANSRYIFFVS